MWVKGYCVGMTTKARDMVYVERVEDGLMIEFADGYSAFYSAALLRSTQPSLLPNDSLLPDEDDPE